MGIFDRLNEWKVKKQYERVERKHYENEVKEKAKAEQRKGYEEGFVKGARTKARREAYAKASSPGLGQRMASNFMSNRGMFGMSGRSRRSRRSSGGGFGLISPMSNVNPNTGTFVFPGASRHKGHKGHKRKGKTIVIRI